ncbi:hypothetical protein ACIRFH_31795 [Streptomyces sp. NPDC093586]|uniref:hypothetical protein n=1 Tax=Streptomyces sp. NPDC093586 TaxID=3366042 RepID=UPI0038262148
MPAPLGWCAYIGWVGLRPGRRDGCFAVQRLWHNELDGGLWTLHQVRRLLWRDPMPRPFLVWVPLTLIAAVVSVVLFGLSARDRQAAAAAGLHRRPAGDRPGQRGVCFPGLASCCRASRCSWSGRPRRSGTARGGRPGHPKAESTVTPDPAVPPAVRLLLVRPAAP